MPSSAPARTAYELRQGYFLSRANDEVVLGHAYTTDPAHSAVRFTPPRSRPRRNELTGLPPTLVKVAGKVIILRDEGPRLRANLGTPPVST